MFAIMFRKHCQPSGYAVYTQEKVLFIQTMIDFHDIIARILQTTDVGMHDASQCELPILVQ